MSTLNIRLYEFARKEMNFSEEKAKEFVQAIDEVVRDDIKGEGINELATKSFVKDEVLIVREEIHKLELKVEQTKGELTKVIFWAGLIQFLAIVGSLVGIISFMLRK
jgi:hypothetical protein